MHFRSSHLWTSSQASSVLFPLWVFLLLLFSDSAAAHGGAHVDDDSGEASARARDLRSRSLILVKIWCLMLVFAGTFAGGISPYFLKWNDGFLVLGTQFAGGVFFGTAMMHFLSDSDETFRDLSGVSYPFAFMLACAGYALTMLVDCAVSGLVASGKAELVDAESRERADDEVDLQGESFRETKCYATEEQCTQSKVEDRKHDNAARALVYADSLGDSILLILALCFHSVFEGIAIGVAEGSADAWRALWTVSLHKVFAAMAMGIALLRMMPNRPLLSCVAYAFAFAISSPVGVAIGIVVDATAEGRAADWIYAVSMGIACGVFIYVSINHLLLKGYQPRTAAVAGNTPCRRWLAAAAGIGVIAVVMIWDT